MTTHQISVGDRVQLTRTYGSVDASVTYRVIAIMPERDGSPQYRLKSEESSQERMTKEDDLILISQPKSRDGDTVAHEESAQWLKVSDVVTKKSESQSRKSNPQRPNPHLDRK